MNAAVDLYWLPLGAGGRSVRLNGRVFEAVASRLEHRTPCALYHSALVVSLSEGEFVIEMAPAAGDGAQRGVVAEGPVGTTPQDGCASSGTRSAAGAAARSLTSSRRWTARAG